VEGAIVGERQPPRNPSLPSKGIVFIIGGEPQDHELFAQDDKRLIIAHPLSGLTESR